MKVTPNVFEASLKCPTKCWLRATGESSAGNGYAEWVKAQDDSYRTTETARLIAELANNEVARVPVMENLMAAKWRLASSLAVEAQTNYCVLETELHAMERVPAEDQGKPTEFIPIRFVFSNKLGNDDKLLLGFDVFALSASLGREIGTGMIIHGDDSATLRVKTSTVKAVSTPAAWAARTPLRRRKATATKSSASSLCSFRTPIGNKSRDRNVARA